MKKFLLLSLLLALGVAHGQTTQGIVPQVAFSEVMYNPPESNTDSLEYLEIHNYGSSGINLQGWQITVGVVYTFPNITIPANGYLVICADSVAFLNFYGFSAYEFNNALNNSDDSLRLTDSNLNLIDVIRYRSTGVWPQGPPSPNAGGPSIEFCDFNLDNAVGSNWAISTNPVGISMINGLQLYGTPGQGCSAVSPPIVASAMATSPTTVDILFNEAINTTAENVSNYTGLGIVTSAVRDVPQTTVTLTLAQPLLNGVPYTVTINNVQDLNGTAMSAPQSFPILFNNTIADIQITEIMYDNPGSDDYEFIEIYNRGASPAYVGGYTFTSGIGFTFPPDTIAPGGFVYITANSSIADPFYNFDSYEFTGTLANGGEKLQLENTNGDVIDSLTYAVTAPWPTGAQATGPSITLCDASTDNSNGANWSTGFEYIGNVGVDAILANIELVSCFVGVAEDVAAKNILLAPNPVAENLVLTVKNNNTYTMQVLDIAGRIVLSQAVMPGVNTYDASALPAGMYFVKLSDGNSVHAIKFLKN